MRPATLGTACAVGAPRQGEQLRHRAADQKLDGEACWPARLAPPTRPDLDRATRGAALIALPTRRGGPVCEPHTAAKHRQGWPAGRCRSRRHFALCRCKSRAELLRFSPASWRRIQALAWTVSPRTWTAVDDDDYIQSDERLAQANTASLCLRTAAPTRTYCSCSLLSVAERLLTRTRRTSGRIADSHRHSPSPSYLRHCRHAPRKLGRPPPRPPPPHGLSRPPSNDSRPIPSHRLRCLFNTAPSAGTPALRCEKRQRADLIQSRLSAIQLRGPRHQQEHEDGHHRPAFRIRHHRNLVLVQGHLALVEGRRQG